MGHVRTVLLYPLSYALLVEVGDIAIPVRMCKHRVDPFHPRSLTWSSDTSPSSDAGTN